MIYDGHLAYNTHFCVYILLCTSEGLKCQLLYALIQQQKIFKHKMNVFEKQTTVCKFRIFALYCISNMNFKVEKQKGVFQILSLVITRPRCPYAFLNNCLYFVPPLSKHANVRCPYCIHPRVSQMHVLLHILFVHCIGRQPSPTLENDSLCPEHI